MPQTDPRDDQSVGRILAKRLASLGDAPLIVPNDTGQRLAERLIGRAYSAYGAAVPRSIVLRAVGVPGPHSLRGVCRADAICFQSQPCALVRWTANASLPMAIGRRYAASPAYAPHRSAVWSSPLAWRRERRWGGRSRDRARSRSSICRPIAVGCGDDSSP